MSIPRDTTRRPVPIHPGEFLREDYMEPLGLSTSQLASDLGVEEHVVADVVDERAGLSTDLAYRLALYFDMSPEFWTNMQASFELNAIFHTRIQELRQQVRTRAA